MVFGHLQLRFCASRPTCAYAFSRVDFGKHLQVGVMLSAEVIDHLLVLRWLDVTPTSRIITRCTQDIQSRMYAPLRFES